MSKCKFQFHSPRGTTHGDGAVHHPCGCAVLVTDRYDHENGKCGGTTLCYFCANVATQTCERMLERIDGKFEHCDEPAALGTRYCWEHQQKEIWVYAEDPIDAPCQKCGKNDGTVAQRVEDHTAFGEGVLVYGILCDTCDEEFLGALDPPDHIAAWEAEADVENPGCRNAPTEAELREEKRREGRGDASS